MSAPPAWATFLLLLISIGLIGRGLLFTLGYDRTWARAYFDEAKPVQARNAPFAMLPTGLGLAALLLIIPAQDTQLHVGATFLLLATSGTAVILAAEFVLQPPARLKPRWLRESEAETAALVRVAPVDKVIVRGLELVGVILAILGGVFLLASLASGIR